MHNATSQSSHFTVPPLSPGRTTTTPAFKNSSLFQNKHSSAGHHAGVFFVATTATGLLKTEVPLNGTSGVQDSLA